VNIASCWSETHTIEKKLTFKLDLQLRMSDKEGIIKIKKEE